MTTTTTAGGAELLDLLPLRAGKRGTVVWMPHADDYTPLAGFARVTVGRDTTTYSVTEYPRAVGRGFMLTKVGGRGTDRRRAGYAVECVGSGDRATGACECDGHRTHGHCKHLDSVATLLMNGWL